jgi:hypothetical protein
MVREMLESSISDTETLEMIYHENAEKLLGL